MKKFTHVRSLLILVIAVSIFQSQNIVAEDVTMNIAASISSNSQLALSSEFYPVTPGDIYTLAYVAGTSPVNYSILVDTSYRVRVANLAIIDAKGMSFTTLKERVELIVSKNYPLSGIQFGLSTPGVFRITVKGEVKKTAEQDSWALARLSTIVAPHVTPYSSLRNVTVLSLSGKTKSYDLFKSSRFGDLSQDPFLRPGDIVTLNRVERVVTIEGAVERPGTYQLLANEGLRDLVELYGSKFTPVADSSRIELVRFIESSYASGQKMFLSKTDVDANFELNNFDRITVKEISDLTPVMFMEGALSITGAGNPNIVPETSIRIPVQFNQGENYASLVRRYRTSFSSVSDTASAYVIRDDIHIPLNLNPMLYDAAYTSEYLVEKNDVLIIPFRQYFVTVSGAVVRPSRYPYIPDRDWSYYISLAGGFNYIVNSRKSVHITDIFGNKRSKTDPITPETVIEANANSFLFYFNQYAPVISTTLSIITAYFTVNALLLN